MSGDSVASPSPDELTEQSAPHSRLGKVPALRRFVNSRGFSGDTAGAALLGLIVSAGVMAAAGELSAVSGVAASVLAAVFIYWIAEGYTEALASQISAQTHFLAVLRHRLVVRWPMVEVAFEPLIAMLIAAAFGASESAAVDVGLIVAVVLLFIFGWIGAGGIGLTGLHRIGAAVLMGALGIGMIALKTWLHTPRHH